MVETGIILAGQSGGQALLPAERACSPLAREPRRVYEVTLDAAGSADSAPLPGLGLHFVYAPTCKNGRPGAKLALQATDEYWSHLVDRVA